MISPALMAWPDDFPACFSLQEILKYIVCKMEKKKTGKNKKGRENQTRKRKKGVTLMEQH